MTYIVRLTVQARREIEEAWLWMRQRDPDGASRWWWGLSEAIQSLGEMPHRCSLAPENAYFPEEIRMLLHGKRRGQYRILFHIEGNQVVVLHVRHASRDLLEP